MYAPRHGTLGGVSEEALAAQADRGLTTVSMRDLTETLCGRDRPTHFAGVCTVVAKLFHIVQPNLAFFGAKDYQQGVVLRRMVYDLNMPLDLVICPTMREPDGLAMSSRNAYLSLEERQQATALYGALRRAEEVIRQSHPPAIDVIREMRDHLKAHAPQGKIDYVQLVDPVTLEDVQHTVNPAVAALAVRIGPARLIDNLRINP
jgi:pantoate--beta-alanine ligase